MEITIDAFKDLINEYKKVLPQFLNLRNNENPPQDIIDKIYNKLDAICKQADKYLPK